MSVVGTAQELLDRRDMPVCRGADRQYRRVYLVEVNNRGDGPLTVLTAPGLPQDYTQYTTATETDLNAIVRERTPRQVPRTWWLYEVDILYDTQLTLLNPNRQEDPRLWEPKMYTEEEFLQVPVTATLKQGTVQPDQVQYEDPVENSAGFPFVPQPLVDECRHTVVIERNEVSFSNLAAMKYVNAVNSDHFGGAYPRQLKIRTFRTTGRRSALVSGVTVYYYPVIYRLQYKRETWDIQVLDQGAQYLMWGWAPYPFVDVEGHNYIGKLDGSGGSLALSMSATADAYYVRKRHYKEEVFGLLNLPQVFP